MHDYEHPLYLKFQLDPDFVYFHNYGVYRGMTLLLSTRGKSRATRCYNKTVTTKRTPLLCAENDSMFTVSPIQFVHC